MQVQCQNSICACGNEKIGYKLCRDWHSGLIFAVLPCIAEIGDHRGDAVGACPSGRVDQNQQLHQILIGWRAGWLHDKDVSSADVLVDFDSCLTVWKGTYDRVAQGGADRLANSQCQLPVS